IERGARHLGEDKDVLYADRCISMLCEERLGGDKDALNGRGTIGNEIGRPDDMRRDGFSFGIVLWKFCGRHDVGRFRPPCQRGSERGAVLGWAWRARMPLNKADAILSLSITIFIRST